MSSSKLSDIDRRPFSTNDSKDSDEETKVSDSRPRHSISGSHTVDLLCILPFLSDRDAIAFLSISKIHNSFARESDRDPSPEKPHLAFLSQLTYSPTAKQAAVLRSLADRISLLHRFYHILHEGEENGCFENGRWKREHTNLSLAALLADMYEHPGAAIFLSSIGLIFSPIYLSIHCPLAALHESLRGRAGLVRVPGKNTTVYQEAQTLGLDIRRHHTAAHVYFLFLKKSQEKFAGAIAAFEPPASPASEEK